MDLCLVTITENLAVNVNAIQSVKAVDAGVQITFFKGSFETVPQMTVEDVLNRIAEASVAFHG